MSKFDASAFAKCVYCRDACHLSSTVCERCEKNEQKYGKPSTCQYCQLPSAFLGKSCQHCSNNEKRFGTPQQCQHCKQKAAFVKREDQKNKKLLCRLCKLTYTRSLAVAAKHKVVKRKNSASTEETSTAVLPKKPFLGGSSFSTIGSSSPSVQQAKEALGEHVLTVTQLKDEALMLQRQIQAKDHHISERDKKITELKSEILRMDHENRHRILQVQKQHQVEVNRLQEKIHALNRQISALTKLNKSTKKVDEKV